MSESVIAAALTELGLRYEYNPRTAPASFLIQFKSAGNASVPVSIFLAGTIAYLLHATGLPFSDQYGAALLEANAGIAVAKIAVVSSSVLVIAELPLHNVDAGALQAAFGGVLDGADRVRRIFFPPQSLRQ